MGVPFAVPPSDVALEGLAHYLDGRVRICEETQARLERLASRPDRTPEQREELGRTLLQAGHQLDRWRSWREAVRRLTPGSRAA